MLRENLLSLRPLHFWLGLFLMVSSWFWLYLDSLPNLFNRWDSKDNSYCYLVPVLFVYLVFVNRKKIKTLSGGLFWPSLIFLGLSSLFFLSGKIASLETLIYISMWMTTLSGLILVFGFRSLKFWGFPLVILAFAVPPPPFINRMLSFHLKLLSSKLSIPFFRLLNMPVFLEGNHIDLGFTQLQIVDACSGLRYFFPIILLSLVMGYFLNRNNLARLLLTIFSIPVAVITNAFRIVIIGVVSKWYSHDILEGNLHETIGIIIFLLALILLFLGSVTLKRIFPNKNQKNSDKHHKSPGMNISRPQTIWLKSIVFSLFLIGTSLLPGYIISAHQVTEHKDLSSSFPSQINNWQGDRRYLNQNILNSLWADDYISATFKNTKTGNILHLLIPYYQYQTTQHTAHAPTSCLLGSGFNLISKRVLEPNKEGKRKFPVQQMVLKKQGQTVLSNFWFEQRGRVITNEYLNKFYLFWDGLTKARTDGALVRIEMYLKPDQSVSQGQKILDPFLSDLKYILNSYIPN